MKKILLILLTFSLLPQVISAQYSRKAGKEKIKAFKVAHITEKLSLTEKEAQKFWPIYNEFEEKKEQLFYIERKKIKKQILAAGGIEEISNKEAESILKEILDVKKNHLKNKEEFLSQVSKFLSPKKILQLEIAEHEFNRKLVKKLRENRGLRR